MTKIFLSLLRWVSTFLQAGLIYARPSRRRHLSDWYFARSIRFGRRMSSRELKRLERLFDEEILVPLEKKVPIIILTGTDNDETELINWVHQPKLA